MKLSPVRVGADVVSFSAYQSANQSGIANEAWTKVICDAVLLNDSSLYNTTLGRWTPPAGKCQLAAHVGFISSTLLMGTPLLVAVFKNGAQFKTAAGAAVSSVYAGANITIIDVCNGTDYYEIGVFAYVSAPAVTGAAWTYFMGTQI
jgi:hypothetical protein